MSFLNLGLFAGGAAAVSIPIIIHLLFRRRRKPIDWGAMRFLLEAYRRRRRRLTLEQLLLLAARCLVILLLAAAIGRPILERAGALGQSGSRTVYLLIDNGLASSARDGETGQPALERHKRTARRILNSLGGADRASLLSLGAPADPVVAPPSADLGAIGRLIDELAPTDAPTDIVGALERVRAEIEGASETGADEAVIVLLSDFLSGSVDAASPAPQIFEGVDNLRLLAAQPWEGGAGPSNVQIVGVDPLRPLVLTGPIEEAADLAGEQVRVRLRRTGAAVESADATTIRLSALVVERDARRAGAPTQSVVRWSPGQSEATTSLALSARDLGDLDFDPARSDVALLAEIDRDAIAGDNAFRRPLQIRQTLRVGVLARLRFGAAPRADRLDAADWVRLALRPVEGAPIEINPIDPAALDGPSLASLGAAILPRPDLVTDDGWRLLRIFVDRGGMLLVFPPAEPRLHLWSDAMTEALDLPWRIAREPVEHEPTPARFAAEQPRSDLFEIISEELSALTAPIRIFRTLPIEQVPPRVETLLALEDGSPWAIASAPTQSDGQGESDAAGERSEFDRERGLVVYMASAPNLEWTDLPAKPLMVPLMQELTRQGVARAAGAWIAEAGSRLEVPTRAARLETVRLDAPAGEAAPPAMAITSAERTEQPVRSAALLRAVDDRGARRGLVAVNAAADAGRTDAQSPAAVQAWLGGLGLSAGAVTWLAPVDSPPGDAGDGGQTASLVDDSTGSPLSFPLFLAALIIALLETVMARFFSHASRDDEGPAAEGGAE